jgi:hypothetical protein
LYGCQDIGKQLANEKADASARKGSAKAFTGPEPVFGISKEQPVGPFLRGSNYNTRYIGPTWQVTEQVNDGQTIPQSLAAGVL